jgi:hypothetical protein
MPPTDAVLEPRHLDMLTTGSGIAHDVIAERGWRSVSQADELKTYGFGRTQLLTPGLLGPIWTPDSNNGLYTFRPDLPRLDKRGKPRKYEWPARTGMRLDVPPRCRDGLANTTVDLWVTEGLKKGDAGATHGLTMVALQGVWGFLGANVFGATTFLADWDYIALKRRNVHIVFDSDVMTKSGVQKALERLTEHLQRKGAHVDAVYLPNGAHGEKVGLDDFLLEHDLVALEACINAPRPRPSAAPPAVELLEGAPPALRRPLGLFDNSAYAATWLYVRATITESLNRHGDVVRHDPPIVETRRELFVVRSDSVVFGPGEPQGLDNLELEVRLADKPREGRTWRARSVKHYRDGARPDLADVFSRVAQVYDTFIDFDRSLADQRSMCELSACLSLATWFSDAFTVLGYPWPNGERGSGKTHWLTCWARTSYLGEVLLSSGSFAALRDLADYDAALGFDDAEVLSNPKQADANKRELLLAGNRRGAAVPLKEQRADGRGWELRWTNAYCPKAYSAIRLPDPVLGSRSLILPLVRTTDAQRGNADPAEDRRWPCDRLALQDDLWACALHFLPTAARVWSELDQEVDTVGREFEPWRAVLAVARLVEQQGVEDLEARMRALLAAYQDEKSNGLVEADWTVLVVRALVCAISAIRDSGDISRWEGALSATQIVQLIKDQADEDDEDTEWATPASWPNPEQAATATDPLRQETSVADSKHRGRGARSCLRNCATPTTKCHR